MGGSKTSTQTSQSKTTSTPWDAAAQYFPSLYDMGQKAVNNSQNLAVPDQFVAGPAGGQLDAIQQMYQLAPGLGAVASPLQDMAKKVASGFFLDPNNDPTFAGAANAAISPITRQLTETVLPGLQSGSIKNGGIGGAGPSAYGGAGLALDRNAALKDWETQAGNITSSMANASRQAGMNLIPQAGNMATTANQLALAPATTTGLAGTQEQSFAQNAIQDALQKYGALQQSYWQGLQPFANLLTTGGFRNGTSDSTQTSTTPAPDMGTQILQGLSGAAGIAGSLFTPGLGGTSAMGNIFSGLGSMFAPSASSMMSGLMALGPAAII